MYLSSLNFVIFASVFVMIVAACRIIASIDADSKQSSCVRHLAFITMEKGIYKLSFFLLLGSVHLHILFGYLILDMIEHL